MTDDRLHNLMERYFNGASIPGEEKVLMEMILREENEGAIYDKMEDVWRRQEANAAIFSKTQRESMLQQIVPTRRLVWLKRAVAIAAVLVLALGLGVYYFNSQSYKSQKSSQITVQTKAQDIAPGSNKAIWTLTDGKKIELDSTVLDMTAKQAPLNNVGYNELRTPRGGQYQLILPDGSKVWLNAASYIKYPVAFKDKERKVIITGEAYFEIAKDATKPFKVSGGGETIEVLGTSFNANVYDDEPASRIALFSGSIKIGQTILQPGQAFEQGHIVETNGDELAWKSGLFSFSNTPFTAVMRQLCRWYNLDVQYNGSPPAEKFSGKLPRDASIEQVLRVLQNNKIKIKLEGNTISITP